MCHIFYFLNWNSSSYCYITGAKSNNKEKSHVAWYFVVIFLKTQLKQKALNEMYQRDRISFCSNDAFLAAHQSHIYKHWSLFRSVVRRIRKKVVTELCTKIPCSNFLGSKQFNIQLFWQSSSCKSAKTYTLSSSIMASDSLPLLGRGPVFQHKGCQKHECAVP